MNIKNIIESYATYINPTEEQKEIAEKRLEICFSCDQWVHGTIRDYCKKCGCTTKIKVFAKIENGCPLHKWTE